MKRLLREIWRVGLLPGTILALLGVISGIASIESAWGTTGMYLSAVTCVAVVASIWLIFRPVLQFSAALVLGLSGLAGAQGDRADPVGTWKCAYEIGDMKLMSTLTIKKDGDKLAGTMSWPNQKETKLNDVKLKGGTLTFSAVRVFMENKIPIDYKLTILGPLEE